MDKKVKFLLHEAVENTRTAINLAEENALINEQWFLSYLDKLNALSVSY